METILLLIGVLICPILTLGLVLCTIGHPMIGILAMVISILAWASKYD